MYHVMMDSGEARQCYKGCRLGNIFANPEEPLPEIPLGRCIQPHCYNGHMLLTAGVIDGFTDVGYGDIRDRVRVDGTHWLRPELKEFFNTKLGDSNDKPSGLRKVCCSVSSPAIWAAERVGEKLHEKLA